MPVATVAIAEYVQSEKQNLTELSTILQAAETG